MPVTPEQKYLKDMKVGECGYTSTYLTVRNGRFVVNRYRSIYPTEVPYSAQICRVRDGVWVDPTATYLLYSDPSDDWSMRLLDFLFRVSPLRVVNEGEVRKPETAWMLESIYETTDEAGSDETDSEGTEDASDTQT